MYYLNSKFRFFFILFISLFLSPFGIVEAQTNDSINNIITSNLSEEIEILALGDPTHTEGKINTHRIDLVKKLAIQRDFRVIVFESNTFEMYKAYQKFLKTGANEALFEGMHALFPCQEFVELFDFVKEQNAKGDSIIIAGFTPNFSGENTLDNLKNSIDDYLNRIPQLKAKLSEEEKASYYESLFPLTHHGVSNLFVNSEKLHKTLLPYTKLILSSIQSTKEQNIEKDVFLAQMLTNILQLHSDSEGLDFNERGNLKDTHMFSNLKFLREQYPNKKLILWGSSTHFYKNAKSIDDAFFQNDRVCFAEYIAKEFKDKYFFIAYSAFSGSRKGAFVDRKIKEPKANTLEKEAQSYPSIVKGKKSQIVNFSALLDYPTTSFKEKIDCRILGHYYYKMQIEKVCDAIIILDDCKPYTEVE